MQQPDSILRTGSVRASSARWRILALLVLASFVSYVLRYIVSIAGPSLMAQMGLSEAQFGWVLAAFAAGYALCQYPAGLIVDRFGGRRVMAVCLVLWAILTMATGALPGPDRVPAAVSLALLMLVRFAVGVFHAPIYPATGALVSRWFEPGAQALPHGLSSTGLTLGTAATATVLTAMIALVGWRVAFVWLALPALLLAALWWWYLRDDPREHRGVNAAELERITAADVGRLDKASGGAWRRVIADRNVLLLTGSYFCMNYVFYQFFNWVNYYLLTARGFDASQAALMTSLQWIVAALGATLGGLLCDALCRRIGRDRGCRWPAILGLTLCAACLLVGALATQPFVAVAALAGAFLCNQIAEPAYWAAAMAVGGRDAGAACGVMNMGGNLVGFVNALLVPLVAAKAGWPAALASGALFAIAGAALWLAVRTRRPAA